MIRQCFAFELDSFVTPSPVFQRRTPGSLSPVGVVLPSTTTRSEGSVRSFRTFRLLLWLRGRQRRVASGHRRIDGGVALLCTHYPRSDLNCIFNILLVMSNDLLPRQPLQVSIQTHIACRRLAKCSVFSIINHAAT